MFKYFCSSTSISHFVHKRGDMIVLNSLSLIQFTETIYCFDVAVAMNIGYESIGLQTPCFLAILVMGNSLCLGHLDLRSQF